MSEADFPFENGDEFENIPVLMFIGYDKVVVLLKGRPELAVIDGSSNNFGGGDIGHIPAPAGTVADLKVIIAKGEERRSLSEIDREQDELEKVLKTSTVSEDTRRDIIKRKGEIKTERKNYPLRACNIRIKDPISLT